ncbi:SigE family RNA polymerase sigma factor [Nocardioides limicola]|uniref:SigE family RNA polymerase sigma factor n=1 Tax=Nocardioides limicola TaxID=2803368 RepID=UPI00193BF4FD|nr:SigE family RNA polymerase sigma factor [Nocardioides sp. DJM-14]
MDTREPEAFEAFVRARYRALLGFGRALTASPEDAADLVHDALASTLLAWDRVESKGDPEGFVRRAMVNRNISTWRRRAHEKARLASVDPADGHPEPEVERAMVLLAAVRRLPARQRTVIALRFYQDLPVAEVASYMGCSEGTVKSQTAKAMVNLRAALTDNDTEEVDRGRLPG